MAAERQLFADALSAAPFCPLRVLPMPLVDEPAAAWPSKRDYSSPHRFASALRLIRSGVQISGFFLSPLSLGRPALLRLGPARCAHPEWTLREAELLSPPTSRTVLLLSFAGLESSAVVFLGSKGLRRIIEQQLVRCSTSAAALWRVAQMASPTQQQGAVRLFSSRLHLSLGERRGEEGAQGRLMPFKLRPQPQLLPLTEE